MVSVGTATVAPAIHSHTELMLSKDKTDEQDRGPTQPPSPPLNASPTPQPLLDGNNFGRFKAAAGITPSDCAPNHGGFAGLRQKSLSIDEYLACEPPAHWGWPHMRWRIANFAESTPARTVFISLVMLNGILIG